jgi:N-acetylneuraminic acid mutarotase
MTALQRIPAAVELDNGSVLVVGGWNKSHAPISSAEMFDASTIQWVSVAPMQLPRSQATVTNLGGGRILVAGGWISHNSDGGWTATSSAEIYDPGTGTWSYTGSMSMPRALASATLLADGRVLVAGGDQAWVGSTGESVLSSAEVYDPRAGTWSAAGNMSSPRAAQFAGRLPDGRVLVSGGWAGGQKHGIASADIYDPASGWSGAAPMPAALAQGRAVTLLDGRLMVIGGLDAAAGITSMVEIFDPGSMSWQRTGTLMQAVYWPAAVALRDGRVLVAGGGADSQTSRVLQICTPPSL